MTRKFVFDVDGTLTPTRQKIDTKFADFFLEFCKNNLVYFVTGNEKHHTIEQLGLSIYNSAQLACNCAGNEIWQKDKLIYSHDWKPEIEVLEFLGEILKNYKFTEISGNHFEYRKGMLNFSITGKQCTIEQRNGYKDFDKKTKNRIILSEQIKSKFPNIDVYIAGDTGLDRYKKDYSKAQVIPKIRTSETDILFYYGDQIFPGGIDYDIAMLCNRAINVCSWSDTYQSLLNGLYK